MAGFDQSDIVASLASGRVVAKVQALLAGDWGEILYFEAVAGKSGPGYLTWMTDVPCHHGDSDGELGSVNMLAPISP